MTNPVGIISMQFIRPFSMADLHLFDHIKKLGFDFIELLVPEEEDGVDLTLVRKTLDGAGLDIVLAARVNAARSIASLDQSARQGGACYLRYCIEVAQILGATIIGGPIYGEPLVFAGRAPAPVSDSDMAARKNHLIEELQKLMPQAESAACTLALEPLNRFETDMISTTAQAIEIVDAVNHKSLGIMLDSFHMNMEERSVHEAIRDAGERVVHFQANENHRGFPGTGHIDWPLVMRALKDIDYRGPVSLEPFRRDDDRVGLPIATWRKAHEDETQKLIDGLALIRSCLKMAAYRQ